MSQVNDYTQFCKEWLGAWTGNKPDGLLPFYTDDAFYSDPANPSGLEGKERLSNYFKKLLAKNPDWVWQAVEIFNTEKGFTLKWQAAIPVKDTTINITGLDIVELTGKQISRNEVYFDRSAWLSVNR